MFEAVGGDVAESLVYLGFDPKRLTMRTYEGAARLLCEQIARRGLRKGELVGRPLTAAHAAALEAIHPNKYNQKRYCLERFIDALVEAGVAERPQPKRKAPTPLDRLHAEYESYLRPWEPQPGRRAGRPSP